MGRSHSCHCGLSMLPTKVKELWCGYFNSVTINVGNHVRRCHFPLSFSQMCWELELEWIPQTMRQVFCLIHEIKATLSQSFTGRLTTKLTREVTQRKAVKQVLKVEHVSLGRGRAPCLERCHTKPTEKIVHFAVNEWRLWDVLGITLTAIHGKCPESIPGGVSKTRQVLLLTCYRLVMNLEWFCSSERVLLIFMVDNIRGVWWAGSKWGTASPVESFKTAAQPPWEVCKHSQQGGLWVLGCLAPWQCSFPRDSSGEAQPHLLSTHCISLDNSIFRPKSNNNKFALLTLHRADISGSGALAPLYDKIVLQCSAK